MLPHTIERETPHAGAMTDEQVDILRDITPKRDYLLISANNCRIMRTKFDKESLADRRAEPAGQRSRDEAMQSGERDLRERYVRTVLSKS